MSWGGDEPDEEEANLGSEECGDWEEGRRGVNSWEGDARKEGEVTAGQTNTLSARWDQTAISARVCARTSR